MPSPAFVDLVNQQIGHEFAASNQYIAVAEMDNTVVGIACAFGAHDDVWGCLLENLHVSPNHK